MAELIGTIEVNPPTVRPGESVFVQVHDTNGHPYTHDAGVRITIQGVQAPARFYQFSTPGVHAAWKHCSLRRG